MPSAAATRLFLLASVPSILAHPNLSPRAAAQSQCDQYSSLTSGPYTLSANLWGQSSGSGSQCSSIDGLDGSSLAWSTNWTWSGGETSVKSFTNAELTSFEAKAINAYTGIPTSWSWEYSGDTVNADVAYDCFLDTSADTSSHKFEVMIWLGLLGDAGPISTSYPWQPIASTTIGGVAFDLAYGLNGAMKVYSFIATSHSETDFSGDVLPFFQYLAQNEGANGFTQDLVVQSVQAGTEPMTGSGAVLRTSAFMLQVR